MTSMPRWGPRWEIHYGYFLVEPAQLCDNEAGGVTVATGSARELGELREALERGAVGIVPLGREA